ncbi:MAG: aminodeoxychorismate lyase [Rhodocyclaceae bacterium]|nr:aminodeoxychorismate lyase [Rhodocyclaceae bacterium]
MADHPSERLSPGPDSAGPVPADDRGLLYGDGVFRTFRHGPRGVLDREGQFAVLARDCEALGIAAPGAERLDAAIFAATRANVAAEQVVRITVTRGGGPRGYRPPAEPRPALYVNAAAAPARTAWDAGYRLRTCALRLGHQPRLAGVKHLNRLENVLARAEWDDPAIDDGVLLGQTGEVVETVSANLFWRSGDNVFTPALNLAGVAGRQRARVLEWLRAHDTPVMIGHFPASSLASADEAWVCNSVIGLRAVTAMAAREPLPGVLAERLAKALFADWQAVVP